MATICGQNRSIGLYSLTLALILVLYLISSKVDVLPQSNSNLSLATRDDSTNIKRKLSSEEPAIPTTLIFTDVNNILKDKTPKQIYLNVKNTIKLYEDAWRKVYDNPDIRVKFLTDDDCLKVIKKVYPMLTEYFVKERKGPIKGDICRNAALYHYGGYYFDVDMKTVQPVILDKSVPFATVLQPYTNEFFNSFIAAAPGHPYLRRSMRYMQLYYEGVIKGFIASLGPVTLKWAYDSFGPEKQATAVIFEEISMDRLVYQKMYPNFPLQKGYGCCCNFVVHDPAAQKIYFYSRIVSPKSMKNNRCSSGPIEATPHHKPDV